MLGSNPSADSGPKTEAECHSWHSVSYELNPKDLGIGINAINPGGMGAGPHLKKEKYLLLSVTHKFR